MIKVLDKQLLLGMYNKMMDARNFDLKVRYLVNRALVHGMTHYSIGEEATSIGSIAAINEDDYITSNHRGHAQCIAKGINLDEMMAEILGRYTGTCKGKGGSMHICNLEANNLGANGIVGGGFAIATGAALSQKMQNTGRIVVCYFGEGATNEGSFHESLNFASIHKLPVIFFCINNKYGISSNIEDATNIKYISDRAVSYGIEGIHIADGNDVIGVYHVMKEAAEKVRSGSGPILIEAKTYRHFGHSSADAGKYRDKKEVDEWKAKDPVKKFQAYLLNNNVFTTEELKEPDEASVKRTEHATEFAVNSEMPPLETALTDVYAE